MNIVSILLIPLTALGMLVIICALFAIGVEKVVQAFWRN